jgi:hypothetical protein
MQFVNPLLLFGAAAAIVPIVLHLIMRQKPQHLEFPALRFLQKRQVSNTRRLRLRHLLLLALRVVAVCVLAFLLARPSITASGVLAEREAPVAAALVFDTSPRMDYRQANQTRIEAAQEFSRWLLGQLPAESQVAVLESRLDSAAFQVDQGAAQQRIDRLETTARGKPLAEVIQSAADVLKTSEKAGKEIYIFTDLTRAAWDTGDAARLQQRLTELHGVGVYVIDVGVEQPQDYALGELSLSAQSLAKNSPLTVRTDLGHIGPPGSRTIELHILDELGRPQKRSQETFDIGDQETQPVAFSLSGLPAGTQQGFLRIVGEDGLKVDDTRYFTVEVKQPWPVLIAAPSPADEYAFFLSEALAPEHFRKNDQARFRCEVAIQDELEKRDLAPYAAVCLLDPAPLQPRAWKRLADYAAAGGGVAIFLGRNAEAVESFNNPSAQELLPGTLASQARYPDGDLALAPDNFQHPLLARFGRRAGTIPWEDFPVFRFSDGQPAILERPLGRGRVLTMTTPVSDSADEGAWNLLPTGTEPWPFVMLSNEMLFYLVGSADSQLNYVAGQTATLRLDPGATTANYLLTTPSGEQIRRTANTTQGVIVEPSTEWVGNYRVQAGGREGGLDRGFSVNLPPDATDLTRLEEGGLERSFGPVKHQVARTHEELVRDRAFAQVGTEIFPLLALLLALVMGAEHALANLFYRKD